MPLSVVVIKKIQALAEDKDPNGLIVYLKEELTQKRMNPQDVLEYVRTAAFDKKPRKPKVVNAATINCIGVILSNLDAKEYPDCAQYKKVFYKLASDRGNDWGSRNYAAYLVNLNPPPQYESKEAKEALEYAERAVQQAAEEENSNPAFHKFVLCKALRVNRAWVRANTALMEYIDFTWSQKASDSKSNSIKIALNVLRKILDEFQGDIKDQEAIEKHTAAHWTANLDELVPLLADNASLEDCAEYQTLKQEAYYLAGRFHEQLSETVKAMGAYRKVTDEKTPYYSPACERRKQLLKNQVKKALTLPVVDDKGKDDKKDEKLEKHEKEEKDQKSAKVLKLPSGIPFPMTFNTAWKRAAVWFHSVEEDALTKEFDERIKQLDSFVELREAQIKAAETEIKIVKGLQQDGKFASSVEAMQMLKTGKEKMQQEFDDLVRLKTEYEKKREEYSAEHRQRLRRHMAETRFFNPMRSKKREAVAALTEKILDHRYNDKKDEGKENADNPIKLDGSSARVVISAERAFQEAAIASGIHTIIKGRFSSQDRANLGIPILRPKEPEASKKYGPVECYKVGATQIKAEHRADPKPQRLGDSFLSQHGAYTGSIYPFLCRLTKGDEEKEVSTEQMLENEKQLAKFMIRYGNTHQALSLAELKGIYAGAEQSDADSFNQICFLILEKEQAQWHSATQENYQLGMSVAQARCLIMLEAGFLRLKEVFRNDVLFGVYSQTGINDNPQKVAAACKRIDTLYIEYLRMKHPQDHFTFLKKHIDAPGRFTYVLTREQAHRDLKYVYGGATDTDDEGYETELDIPAADAKAAPGFVPK